MNNKEAIRDEGRENLIQVTQYISFANSSRSHNFTPAFDAIRDSKTFFVFYY